MAWFWELRRAAGSGPISHTELRAWSDLMGTGPLPWEVRALKAMDNVYLGFAAGAKPERKSE